MQANQRLNLRDLNCSWIVPCSNYLLRPLPIENTAGLMMRRFSIKLLDQRRKLITHSARNGVLYTIDCFNGQIIGAKPHFN